MYVTGFNIFDIVGEHRSKTILNLIYFECL